MPASTAHAGEDLDLEEQEVVQINEDQIETADDIPGVATEHILRSSPNATELVGAFGVRTTVDGQLELRAAGFDTYDDDDFNGEEVNDTEDASESRLRVGDNQDEEGGGEGDLAVATLVSADLPHAQEWSEREQNDDDNINNRRAKLESRRKSWVIGCVVLFSLLVALIFLLLLDVGKRSGKSDNTENGMDDMTQEEYLLSLLPDYSLGPIQEDSTPQAKAFRWMMNDPNFESYPAWRILQRYALATIFFSTGGDSIAGWTRSDNWLSHDIHECLWFSTPIESATSVGGFFGAEEQNYYNISEIDTSLCSGETGEEYQGILLLANGMDGTLPEEMFLLTTLRAISLRNNHLQGTISSRIGHLSHLFAFDVSNNAVGGTIPQELGNLQDLSGLFIFYNQLTGSLPREMAELSSLRYMIIDSNRLTGPLHSEIGRLSNLEGMLIHHNDFTGILPSEFGNLNIRELFLFNNSLSGTLPSELGALNNLEVLFVGESQFTGSLPSQLGLLSRCSYLCIFDTLLSGTVPTELAQISTMEGLVLSKNMLTGQIPPHLGQNSLLWGISMFGNSLSGTLPPVIFNHGLYVIIQLNDNLLSGSIPTKLGWHPRLEILDLSNNGLGFGIPSELGEAKGLQELRLQSNVLFGSIPSELGSLFHGTFSILRLFMSFPVPAIIQTAIPWRSMSLANNKLNGQIPSDLGRMKRLLNLNLSGNQLTGSLTSELGRLTALEVLDVTANGITGTLPVEACELGIGTLSFDCSDSLCGCDCTCEGGS